MRVLLAGGSGIIGSYLYSTLKHHHNVYAIDKNKDNISYINNLDLTERSQTNKFVKENNKFDALIFLVGLAHSKGKRNEFDAHQLINYQTLVNLTEAMHSYNKKPIKIIFASTISVYGERINISLYEESAQATPFSPYAVTKQKAEHYLLDNYLENSWVLRFAPVYSTNFLLNINRRTKAAGNFYKVGNGGKKLSLCNLVNIGSAVQGILNNKVPAGVYNISDTKEYSYNDLLIWKKANWVIPIPALFIKGLYYIGKIMNNIFLKDNAVKLTSDNIFPSNKIRAYVDLPATVNDVKFGND